jgi:hypothetical protein
MSASRCPCGVIAYPGDIVCYDLIPASGFVPGGTGVLQARRLGQESLLEISPELRAAIEADLSKNQRSK